ncbi:hypothetical protein A7K99_12945 [Tatumella citrea]|uniref:Uncharacterized protein n=1 Tax=Tatumella citrea TaxID=53336 RepID=A0A1Y0LA66_TATCI|nr:hypothetical protein A7K98_12955 [Tatumella citrea]ARU98628.1 hypothetical protein A7K99_12945 [Tatumella citrea]
MLFISSGKLSQTGSSFYDVYQNPDEKKPTVKWGVFRTILMGTIERVKLQSPYVVLTPFFSLSNSKESAAYLIVQDLVKKKPT